MLQSEKQCLNSEGVLEIQHSIYSKHLRGPTFMLVKLAGCLKFCTWPKTLQVLTSVSNTRVFSNKRGPGRSYFVALFWTSNQISPRLCPGTVRGQSSSSQLPKSTVDKNAQSLSPSISTVPQHYSSRLCTFKQPTCPHAVFPGHLVYMQELKIDDRREKNCGGVRQIPPILKGNSTMHSFHS